MRFARPLLIALAATSALFIGTAASGQAASNFPPEVTCGTTYKNIPPLVFQECISVSERANHSGSEMYSFLAIYNALHHTTDARSAFTQTELIVDGHVVDHTECGYRPVVPGHPLRCTGAPVFVPASSRYAYGRGFVKDFLSQKTGFAFAFEPTS